MANFDKKKNYNNNNGYKERSSYDNALSGYVGAPYNFIPFYKQVVGVDESQMLVHDVLNDTLLSGEISYEITNMTPLFIDDGSAEHKFYRNAEGKYTIPGSSIRGLIRNNVQILGLSGFDQDIDDYNLMYRNVANGQEKGRYNKVLGTKSIPLGNDKGNISVLLNVKAGYIKKVGDKYKIYQTKVDKIEDNLGEMNYYVLNERMFVSDRSKLHSNFSFFENPDYLLQNRIGVGFIEEERKGMMHYYQKPNNKEYKPGFEEVSYELSGTRHVKSVGAPGRYSNKGYVARTGYMNEKKALYIIPEIDETKDVINIDEQDLASFKIDYEKKKNTLKRTKNMDYFNLPQDDKIKPVFYIRLDGRLYFGFTPRLRLFYDFTIKDGYKQDLPAYDYAKSLFGCINNGNESASFKSKTSFSDAVMEEKSTPQILKDSVILGEPKPSSYLDYLDQTNGTVTYNSKGFKLRGAKQYWLRKEIYRPEQSGNNENVKSPINAIDKGVVFKGKVRFQNLTKDELGLLVWSIKLNDESWMNIGKGKAYGYGAVKFSDIKVSTVDAKKAYSITELSLNPFVDQNSDELIKNYKDVINTKLAGRNPSNIDDVRTIKDFFLMKNSNKMPAPEKIRYMDINKKEYQNRKNKALDIPENVIK